MFPLSSILKAANPEHSEEIQVIADLIEDVCSQPSQLSDSVIHSLPSTSKPSAQPTTLADHMASKSMGARRKCVKRKPKKQNDLGGKSSRHDNVIGNTSPLDTTSLPDLVLILNDSEYIDSDDDEVKIIDSDSNDSSYDSPSYLPSSSHRLLATSDVSTVPVSQLLSPDPSPSTSSDNAY